MGWDAKEKQNELFHKLSRFVIVYRSSGSTDEPGDVIGYVMFRFEEELDEEIIYWYEYIVLTRACRSYKIIVTNCNFLNIHDVLVLGGF